MGDGLEEVVGWVGMEEIGAVQGFGFAMEGCEEGGVVAGFVGEEGGDAWSEEVAELGGAAVGEEGEGGREEDVAGFVGAAGRKGMVEEVEDVLGGCVVGLGCWMVEQLGEDG